MTRGPDKTAQARSQARSRPRSPAHDAVCDLLIEKIRQDRYPSATMMYIVEAQLTDEQVPAYVSMLLDKFRADRYPSMDLLRRILTLA